MTKRPSVLFLTNAGHGQADHIIATLYELLLQDELDIHVASWPALLPTIRELEIRVADETQKTRRPVSFYTCPRSAEVEEVAKSSGLTVADWPHVPGVPAVPRIYQLAPMFLTPWNEDAWLEVVEWFDELIDTIKPDVAVTEPYLPMANDCLRRRKMDYVILSPSSLQPGGLVAQQGLKALYHYPQICTGYLYPLRWRNILGNIIVSFALLYTMLFHPRIRSITAARKKNGIIGPISGLQTYTPGEMYICPSLPELDYQIKKIPSNCFHCGPILLPPVQVDQDLSLWLEKAPTVLISLGAHHLYTPGEGREQAMALRILLLARPDIQVLWKIKPLPGSNTAEEVSSVLGHEIETCKVKLVDSLPAGPASIISTGHIVAYVNHGGANSWFEACWSGVPQVVLPQWFDAYEYAARAEYSGIGIYGSKKSAPYAEAEELGRALIEVVGKLGDETEYRKRAAVIAQLCRKSGGRRMAAGLITEAAKSKKTSMTH